MMQPDINARLLTVGQMVSTGLYGRGTGYIFKIHNQQEPQSIRSILLFGDPVMVTGGRAEFDIVFECGSISNRLPESILRGVQWRIYDTVTDELTLKRLLNNAKSVAVEAEAEKQRQADDRAKLKEELKATYAHLQRVDAAKYNGRITATKNIRTELKAAFPAVKFSVTSETFSMGDAIRISWIDGPTTKEVDAVTKRYQAGSFDGMQDLYEYGNDPFTELFGDAKYVTVSREESFAFAARIVDQYNADYGTACTVKPSIYNGFISPYVSHSEGDNGKLRSIGGRDTHGESIRRMIHETACAEILFSVYKAPKQKQ